ncbi:MAG: hypothetical protein V7459_17700, partial [Oceanicoccus sp.]
LIIGRSAVQVCEGPPFSLRFIALMNLECPIMKVGSADSMDFLEFSKHQIASKCNSIGGVYEGPHPL